MKINGMLSSISVFACLSAFSVQAEEPKIMITPDLEAVEVLHHGHVVTVARNQDPQHTIDPAYTKTSRPCPPFCIQPMHISNVETVGELEVLADLKKIHAGDNSLLIVDSRTSDWLARGTIPGSVNVPWNLISLESATAFDSGQVAETFDDTMHEHFGAVKKDGVWNFDQAKTLVLFCNGIWCPQSSANIHALLKQGYPADKLKWYRGGMQSWVSVGLSVAKPGE